MTQISLDEVKQLARLAKLELSDAQAESMQSEIDSILNYVHQLNEVDTTGVEPTSQVTGLVNSTRPDAEVDYGVDQAGLFKNVHEVQDGYVKVERVIQ